MIAEAGQVIDFYLAPPSHFQEMRKLIYQKTVYLQQIK